VARRGTIAYILFMAISAVSPVGGDELRLFRVGRAEPPDSARAADGPARVGAVAASAGREDAEGAESASSSTPAVRRIPASDPRRPESIIAERKAEGGPSDRRVRSRIDDLRGQKSALERRQAEEKGARSAEVLAALSLLKARDGEVRAHEAAHIATGGRYITSGASYAYQKGPDGIQYAVGGEVGIDASPEPGRPEETVQKMRVVRAAALAPSDPSAADLSVAAAASQTEAEALAEIAQARSEELAAGYAERGGAPAQGDSDSRRKSLDVLA
jgi:hypothetical protein